VTSPNPSYSFTAELLEKISCRWREMVTNYYARILQTEETISPFPKPLSSYARYIPFLLSYSIRYLLL